MLSEPELDVYAGAGLDTSNRPEIQNTVRSGSPAIALNDFQAIVVLDASHPSTENLPTDWPVRDEMCASHLQ